MKKLIISVSYITVIILLLTSFPGSAIQGMEYSEPVYFRTSEGKTA